MCSVLTGRLESRHSLEETDLDMQALSQIIMLDDKQQHKPLQLQQSTMDALNRALASFILLAQLKPTNLRKHEAFSLRTVRIMSEIQAITAWTK